MGCLHVADVDSDTGPWEIQVVRNSKPWEGADLVIDPGVGARLASALAARLATRVPPNVEVAQVGGTLRGTDGRRSSGTPLDFILSETPPPLSA